MSIADELAKLESLRDRGTLSESEYEAAKARTLAGSASAEASGTGGSHTALWALVIVVFLAGAGIVAFLAEASATLQLIAGSAAVLAGLAGAVLAAMEDVGLLAIGGLGLGALVVGAVVFAGLAPVLIPAVIGVLAVGALVTWIGGLMG